MGFFIFSAIIFFIILYFVVKAAVRDGIVEARDDCAKPEEQDKIASVSCLSCGKEYEMDYPKCPNCGHDNIIYRSMP